MSGIYIHIPFCRQACSYCDFYFVTRNRLIPEFVDALIHEVNSGHSIPESGFPAGNTLHTLYMGGGTPSRLSLAQFERLVDALHRRFDLSHLQEFTVEVNPEDITREYAAGLKQLGVTRLSMGIQSFQSELLTFMHRAHTSSQAHRALEWVAGTGFPSFSADLIYGNPGQTPEQLKDDIQQLSAYQPPHISAYSLTIEPGTRLGKQLRLGRITPANDDAVAEHHHLIREKLAAHNILQYEVSNYAKPGHEAMHNSAYWRHEEYLGLGPAAHSFFWAPDKKSAVRRNNPPDIHAYIKQTTSRADQEILSLQTLAEERLMMGLRTREGVPESELASRYHYFLNDHQKKNLEILRKHGLISPDDPIRLTGKGIPLADSILLKLI